MIEGHRHRETFKSQNWEFLPKVPEWSMQASHEVSFGDPLQEPINQFTAAFMRRLGAEGATVLWNDGTQGRAKHLAAIGDLPPPGALQILDAANEHDQGGRAVHCHWRRIPGSELDWLYIHLGVAGGMISIIAEINGMAGKRELIDRALPELLREAVPFFEVWGISFRALELSSNLQGASNALGAGMVIIDCEGEVLFANDAAAALGLHSGAFRINDGMLRASTLSDSLRLQTTIEHVIRGPAAEAVPVVALRRKKGRPVMVAVHRLEPSMLDDTRTAAVLYFFDSERDLSTMIQPACDYYRLSAVEAKLAYLLVQGHSVAESADRLKLKEQTVRSYLKQIFLKTETKRQGELVAVLLHGSIDSVSNRNMQLIPGG